MLGTKKYRKILFNKNTDIIAGVIIVLYSTI